jgi:acyl-CoA hydrolase
MKVHDAGERSVVRMFEPVTAALTVGGTGPHSGTMDIQPLLKLMDIGSCACAEKFTGVQCVTASMGDVVFEYFPVAGELLELTARPVLAGRTSLEIALVVVSQGLDPQTGSLVRRDVCEAFFTYVTTRGPDGEKRCCPPLEGSSSLGDNNGDQLHLSMMGEEHQWERLLAKFRKSLVRIETGKLIQSESTPTSKKHDFEMSEVVLPAHQNHMGHTFGGVVMSWMAKAALTSASRKARLSTGDLRIGAVLRVNFDTGSDVSDHLIFRPHINAVFDNGATAEVEVTVTKRNIATGNEVDINTGYFYVHPISKNHKRPFPATEATQGSAWRRRHLVARRQLLTCTGGPIQWHSDLHEEAPQLTILSTLRRIHHDHESVRWRRPKHSSKDSVNPCSVEWTSGIYWGRRHTFLIRAKAIIVHKVGGPTVEEFINALRMRRPEWDHICHAVTILEESSSKKKESTESDVQWDVVEHIARTPQKARVLHCLCACSSIEELVPLCLLRAWRVDTASGTAIYASRSVRHDKTLRNARTEVLPSGWFIRSVDNGVAVSYVVEHDFQTLRNITRVMSDEHIVSMMTSGVVKWMKQLSSLDYSI